MEREKTLSLFYRQLPRRARLIMSSGHTTSLRLVTVEVLRSACTCRSKVVQNFCILSSTTGVGVDLNASLCVVLQRSSGESGTALPRSLHLLRKLLLLLEPIFALSLATSGFLPDLFLFVLVLLYCLFLTSLCLLVRNCGLFLSELQTVNRRHIWSQPLVFLWRRPMLLDLCTVRVLDLSVFAKKLMITHNL